MDNLEEWLSSKEKIKRFKVLTANKEKNQKTTIICGSNNDSSDETRSNVSFCGELFDLQYRKINDPENSVLSTNVWKNSFDGAPISSDEMQDWINDTVQKIKGQLHPESKILEIGCGFNTHA